MILFLCVTGLTGCEPDASVDSVKKIPVSWYASYTMAELLASDTTILNVTELPKLMNAPWYADINVTHTKVGGTVFSSCFDYFSNVEPLTRTLKDNEMSAYLEFKIMCEATQLLINAHNSKFSFLPDKVLSNASPKLWPKELAFQISTEESKRIAKNPELKTWEDVTPITKHESQSTTKSTYYYKGGYQVIEVLGHGDANNDDIEDVFILSRDQVEGGNYFNMRLFILSVNSQGNWKLIKEI